MPQENGAGALLLGTVVDNADAERKGLIKVLLDGEGKGRTVLAGVKALARSAGADYGAYWLPEVGEQVVLGFLGGALNRPVALGSIYAAKDGMLDQSYDPKNVRKRLRTKGGVELELSDKEDAQRLAVSTPKGLSVRLEDEGERLVAAAGKVALTLDKKNGRADLTANDQLRLTCGKASLTLKSDGTIELSGLRLTIKGDNMTLDGSGLNIKGQKLNLSGAVVELKASGPLTVKGGIVKIN